MYIKDFLFLGESDRRNEDQLNSEQTVPFVVLRNTKFTWEHEVPICLGEKEQLVPFVVFGNTKFLLI